MLAAAGAAIWKVGGWQPIWRRLTHSVTDIMERHREDRLHLFAGLPKPPPGAIVFLGDSLVEQGAWYELLGAETRVINRGISGDTIAGVRSRLDDVAKVEPSAVIVLVGINDLQRGITLEDFIAEFKLLLRQLRQIPAPIAVLGLLPVNGQMDPRLAATANRIEETNQRLAALAAAEGVIFVDAGSELRLADGSLDRRYTNDGLHLSAAGYLRLHSSIRARWNPPPPPRPATNG